MMLMLPSAFPVVAALTVPSLHGYSSACPVLPARLVQMAATSSDSMGFSEPRTIELCQVTDDGQISECEVHEYDALGSEFGAHHFSSDPEAADELFFEMSTTTDDERVHLTLDDWQKLCDSDGSCEVLPEVTEDALQKALGPEHDALAKTRLHLHFGAGRLASGS